MISPSQQIEVFIEKPKGVLIDNAIIIPTGNEINVRNPSTGAKICPVRSCALSEVDAAIEAANNAAQSNSWRNIQPVDRAILLRSFSDLLEKYIDDFIYLDSLNGGMPYNLSTWINTNALYYIRHAADLIATASSDIHTLGIPTKLLQKDQYFAYERWNPVGVVGQIIPSNGPFAAAIIKIAYAVAAGCCVVLKPSELTPLSLLRLAEILSYKNIFPPGVINIITGDHKVGKYLVEHPGIDMVAFTGPSSVGKNIQQSLADKGYIKPILLELGGKSANIIFEDAEMNKAISGAISGIFTHSGQVCTAGSRLLIHKNIYHKVLEEILAFTKTLRIGLALDQTTEVGPLISSGHLEKVLSYMNLAKKENHTILTGGKRIQREGFFVEPTILCDVDPASKIYHEEIFGPVLTVTPFETIQEVISMANDTRYGLATGLWTKDIKKALSLPRFIASGIVWVNTYNKFDPAVSFGGVKESGLGRESGLDGIRAYMYKQSNFIGL